MYANTFNIVIFKRLNKELEIYNSSNYKYNIEIFSTFINNKDTLLLTVNNNSDNNSNNNSNNSNNSNNNLFTLKIPEHYPFKPYQYVNNNLSDFNYFIYIQKIQTSLNNNNNNNNNILQIFYNIYSQKPSKFLKLNKNNCFCCNSILCSINWSPSLNIINVINEIEEIKFIEKYCNLNAYNELIQIFNNNYLNKLSDDLILIIINYIIQ